MSRSIEFRHHPDTPQPGIVDDLLDIVQRVHHGRMVCTLGGQIRVAGALVGEAVVVHDVPVENVHFVVRHGVQCEQYVVDGEVMTGRVQQESTMRQPGEIHDTLASYLQLGRKQRLELCMLQLVLFIPMAIWHSFTHVRSIPGRDQELRKGLQSPKNAPHRLREQIHRGRFVYVQLVCEKVQFPDRV